MQNSNFFNEKSDKRNDIYEFLPTYDPCFLRIFDFLNCPLIKVNKEKDRENNLNNNFAIEEFEKFCLKENNNENENKEKKIKGKKL